MKRLTVILSVLFVALLAVTQGSAQNKKPAVSKEQAQKIALAHIGGGRVVDTDLDKENGKLVYSIEVKTGSETKEVKIDAATGKVLSVAADQDDEQHEDEHENQGHEDQSEAPGK